MKFIKIKNCTYLKDTKKIKKQAFRFGTNDVNCINLIQTCLGYIKSSSISIRLKNNIIRRLKTYLAKKICHW